MSHALTDWLNEASGDIAGGQQPPMAAGSPFGAPEPATTDPNAANPAPPMQDPPQVQQQKSNDYPDVSQDPIDPDMPEEKEDLDFEQWKNKFFRDSVRGDLSSLIDMIHQVRDHSLDSYPRKFVEDNLQILFLRQYANIDKASKEIRRLIKDDLDQNNPSVSVVNHLDKTLKTMPELNNIFIKLKGLLGMKGDLHRKFIASLLGAIQVGSGGNNEDIIYNEKDYSIRISTRFNDKWGRVDIGKWSLREDDPSRYLTDPEQRRMEDGSPEEKDVLRRRVVMESIAETFKRRSFIVNVTNEDGTIYTLGWDLSNSLKNAYTDGKLVVRTIKNENTEAMIDHEGKIIPYVDIKIRFAKETGQIDDQGKPEIEEHDFMERIDGMLFLTAQYKIIREASSAFPGIVLKETPYAGNPSDLNVLQRCVASTPEILLRQC